MVYADVMVVGVPCCDDGGVGGSVVVAGGTNVNDEDVGGEGESVDVGGEGEGVDEEEEVGA